MYPSNWWVSLVTVANHTNIRVVNYTQCCLLNKMLSTINERLFRGLSIYYVCINIGAPYISVEPWMLKIVTGYALLKTLSTPFSPHTFAFSVAVWPLVSAHIIFSSIMYRAGGFWLRHEGRQTSFALPSPLLWNLSSPIICIFHSTAGQGSFD